MEVEKNGFLKAAVIRAVCLRECLNPTMISNKFGVLIHWVPHAITASPQSFLLTYIMV